MKRFTKKLCYYRPVSFLLYVLFTYALYLFSFLEEPVDDLGNPIPHDEIMTMIVAFGIIAFVVWIGLSIYGVLYYYTSRYELTDKEIICKRGVLFQKKSVIEYKKIHAINQKQGLLQRLFGISVLYVDSGSTNTTTTAEVVIYEDSEIVNKLYKRLQGIDTNETSVEEKVSIENQDSLYSFNSLRKLIYSALNVVATLMSIVIASIVILIVLAMVNHFVEEIDWLTVILIGLGIYLIANLLVFIGSCLYSFISLHNFKIIKDQKSLNISYGLFTKINNTFQLNRVKGIKIEQGLIKRIFGFVTVKLEVIGYNHGSDENENQNESIGMLIPLCRKTEVNELIGKILPEYVPSEKQAHAKSYWSFVNLPTLFLAIIMGIITLLILPFVIVINDNLGYWIFILGNVLSFIIIEIIILVTGIFKYYEQDVVIEGNKITTYSGGINRVTTVIKKENIIAIEDITTYHRAKKGIYTFAIHFHTNALTNVIKVENVDQKVKEQLLTLMKY